MCLPCITPHPFCPLVYGPNPGPTGRRMGTPQSLNIRAAQHPMLPEDLDTGYTVRTHTTVCFGWWWQVLAVVVLRASSSLD